MPSTGKRGTVARRTCLIGMHRMRYVNHARLYTPATSYSADTVASVDIGVEGRASAPGAEIGTRADGWLWQLRYVGSHGAGWVRTRCQHRHIRFSGRDYESTGRGQGDQ